MVIGNGLMATTFSHYAHNDDVLIFASGVSNSTTEDPLEFEREIDLVRKAIEDHPHRLFIYFSSCSILDPAVSSRPYARHKLAVEEYIKSEVNDFLILRISNVVGSSESLIKRESGVNPELFLKL